MMSIDFRKLEEISRFTSFVDAISNPVELKKTLDELNQKRDELRELLGAKDTVVKAQEFMAECRKEMQEGFDGLAKKEAEFKSKVETWEADKAKQEFALSEQRTIQANVQKELDESTERMRNQLDEFKAREFKLNFHQTKLDEREADLAKRELDLQEKAEKLRSLLG